MTVFFAPTKFTDSLSIVLPGVSPASRSRPYSPPERGHAAGAHSSMGRPPP